MASAILEPSLSVKRARYAVSAVFLVFGMLYGSWLPHIPDVKRQIGCNDAALGQALLCSGLGAVVSMQCMGSLIHRFGSRNLAVFGGIGACLLIPPLMMHRTIFGLGGNLLALGAFYGIMDVGMNAHAVEVQAHFPKPVLSGIHGWFSFGGIAGGIFASLAVRAGISTVGHLSATSASLLLLLAWCRPNLLPSTTDQNSEGPKFVLPKGFLLFLGVLCAAAFVAEGGILDWCALFVREGLHASAEFAGITTGLCSGAMAAGRFLGDPIVHRFGNRRVVLTGGILCVVGILGAVTAPNLWLSLLSFAVACFGISNIVPTLFNEAGNADGVSTGVGLVAVTTCGYAGFLVGPPVIGFIAHRSSLAVGIATLAVLGVILAIGSTQLPAFRRVGA